MERDLGSVLGVEGQAREGAVRLHPHVPGAGSGAVDGAGFAVATQVRAAGVGGIGRGTALAHIEVSITAATTDRHAQLGAAGRNRDGVVQLGTARCHPGSAHHR
ncbi:hypothetical protein G6F63_014846 [Rhizopus arrhizus]|nr:hypothetical protein G6F63_014846 [Rhizopus arrhizus]